MFWLICPSALFRCFMSNLGVYTESQTEPLDSSNSVNHDGVQVLPVVGIEPATSRWFHSEAPNQMPYFAFFEKVPFIYWITSYKCIYL